MFAPIVQNCFSLDGPAELFDTDGDLSSSQFQLLLTKSRCRCTIVIFCDPAKHTWKETEVLLVVLRTVVNLENPIVLAVVLSLI